MKAFLIVLFAVGISLDGLAQETIIDLTPKRYGVKGDTTECFLCFTPIQLKEVTKMNTRGFFAAQTVKKQELIISHQEAQIHALDQIVKNDKKQKDLLTSQITDRDTLLFAQSRYIKAQDEDRVELNKKILQQDKVNNRNKLVSAVLIVVSLIVGSQL